uniref:Putative secretory peptide-34 n=1 Tax=Pleurobrachia bachei TaxID=34499 RepID=M4H2I3_PLEBA|nr:putative secretory peptide-34 [Pleurobrachia bachei]|eukprot:sb/3470004/
MLKLLVALSVVLFVYASEDTTVEFDVSKDDTSVENEEVPVEEEVEVKVPQLKDEDKVDPPPTLAQLKASQVVLPELNGLQSPDVSQCMEEKQYKDTDAIENDSDMLCAFIAFQANKDMSEPGNKVYASKEEATMRYGIFKGCVTNVQEINADKQRSWRAGVNLFCDMTDSERYPYFHGLRNPDENNELGADDEYVEDDGGDKVRRGGMLLGAARP